MALWNEWLKQRYKVWPRLWMSNFLFLQMTRVLFLCSCEGGIIWTVRICRPPVDNAPCCQFTVQFKQEVGSRLSLLIFLAWLPSPTPKAGSGLLFIFHTWLLQVVVQIDNIESQINWGTKMFWMKYGFRTWSCNILSVWIKGFPVSFTMHWWITFCLLRH